MASGTKKVVISIESRKGGSGKSMVALLLAQKLQKNDYRTLVMDADITGTSITRSVGNTLYPERKGGFWSVKTDVKKNSCKGDGKEAGVANFFSDFDIYLQEHASPEIKIIKDDKLPENSNGKVSTLQVKNDCVNIYGSDLSYDNESLVGGIGSSILFNDLYSRWLLQFTRHICENFSKIFLNENVAIIIDNSPGSSGFIPTLREWLTDMGPEIGKFISVSTLDARDFGACFAEMSEIRRIITQKHKTATYYTDQTSPTISKPEDEAFFHRLYECDYYQQDIDRTLKSESKKFSFIEKFQQYYLAIHKDTPVPSNFHALIINKVPTDLFSTNILSSHTLKTVKTTKEIFENYKDAEGISKVGISKYQELEKYVIHREPLLAYAHLESNKNDPNIDKDSSAINNDFIEALENDPTLKDKINYYSLQIQGAKQLCAICQKEFASILDFFSDESECRQGIKDIIIYMQASQKAMKLIQMTNALNVTMNRLRSILYPFAHKGMHVLFPSVTKQLNLNVISQGYHLTPVNALWALIDRHFTITETIPAELYTPNIDALLTDELLPDSIKLVGDNMMCIVLQGGLPFDFMPFFRELMNCSSKSHLAITLPIAYYNLIHNRQTSSITLPDNLKDNLKLLKAIEEYTNMESSRTFKDIQQSLEDKDDHFYFEVAVRFYDLVADTSRVLSVLGKGIKSISFIRFAHKDNMYKDTDFTVLHGFRKEIRDVTGIVPYSASAGIESDSNTIINGFESEIDSIRVDAKTSSIREVSDDASDCVGVDILDEFNSVIENVVKKLGL